MIKTFKTVAASTRTPGQLPLHVEISEMLAREIQAGILLAGTRLAPERVMAAELGVAIGTLRKALADLESKGMLERVQGSGNYIRTTKPDPDAESTIYRFFRLELIGGGGLPTAEVLSVDRLEKPETVPQFGTERAAMCIRRLRRLNGVDAALEEIWFDAHDIVSIAKEAISDSLYLFYKEQLGFWITHIQDSAGVDTPPEWRPEGYGSGKSSKAWGYIERQGYDQNNRSVEFSRTWFDPATTRYVARWK